MSLVRDRRIKPTPWHWSAARVARDCQWALRGLVLAWPMWDGGDLEVTLATPIRILTDPICGRHGQGHSNAGSHNTAIVVVEKSGKYGRTIAAASVATATRQVVTADMVGFPTTACTIVLHYHKTDATNRNAAAIGCIPDGSSYNGVMNADLPSSDGKAYWDFGGVTSPTTRLGGISGLTYGDDVWVLTTGPRGMEIWQNGVKVASQVATPTRVNSNTAQFGLWGADPATYGGGDIAESGCLLVYDHQLSEAEIRALSLDPWTPFRPTFRPNYPPLTAVIPILGAGDGSLLLSGAGAAGVLVAGAGSGALSLSGLSAGVVLVGGTGDGALDLTALADASAGVHGAGAGVLDLAGEADGAVAITGEADGALDLEGEAAGGVLLTGHGAGSLHLTGQGTGVPIVGGTGLGILQLLGLGTGTLPVKGAGSGALLLRGIAGGTADVPCSMQLVLQVAQQETALRLQDHTTFRVASEHILQFRRSLLARCLLNSTGATQSDQTVAVTGAVLTIAPMEVIWRVEAHRIVEDDWVLVSAVSQEDAPALGSPAVLLREDRLELVDFATVWDGVYDEVRLLGAQLASLTVNFKSENLPPNDLIGPLFCRVLQLEAARFLAIKADHTVAGASLHAERRLAERNLFAVLRSQEQSGTRRDWRTPQ